MSARAITARRGMGTSRCGNIIGSLDVARAAVVYRRGSMPSNALAARTRVELEVDSSSSASRPPSRRASAATRASAPDGADVHLARLLEEPLDRGERRDVGLTGDRHVDVLECRLLPERHAGRPVAFDQADEPAGERVEYASATHPVGHR